MATMNIDPNDFLKYIVKAYSNLQDTEIKTKNPATEAIETQRPISDWLKVQSAKQALAPRSQVGQVGQVGQGWQSSLGSFPQQGGRGNAVQQLMTLNKLSQKIGLGSFLPSASAEGAEGVIGTILGFLALL